MELSFKNLKYKTPLGFDIDIELPGRLVLISGDSATGKSFIAYLLSGEASKMYSGGTESNIAVFNSSSIKAIESIRDLRKHLIVIDNADVVLYFNKELISYINTDRKNQYMIFSRAILDFNTPPYCSGEFMLDAYNKKISVKYEGA